MRRRMQRRSPPYWSEYERVSDYCRDGSQNEYYAVENENRSRSTVLKLFPGNSTATGEFVRRCRRGVVDSCFHVDRSKVLNEMDVRPVPSERVTHLKCSVWRLTTRNSKLCGQQKEQSNVLWRWISASPPFSFFPNSTALDHLPLPSYRPSVGNKAGLQSSSLSVIARLGGFSNSTQWFIGWLMKLLFLYLQTNKTQHNHKEAVAPPLDGSAAILELLTEYNPLSCSPTAGVLFFFLHHTQNLTNSRTVMILASRPFQGGWVITAQKEAYRSSCKYVLC